MKTEIQKNETTILATTFPSVGFAVVTVTAGQGLSVNLKSHSGERRSELLVHGRVFKTFRHPLLFKLFTDILEAGEVNTDHWRRPSQEGGDWFLLNQYHAGAAKKYWDGVFPEDDENEDENKEILFAIHGKEVAA